MATKKRNWVIALIIVFAITIIIAIRIPFLKNGIQVEWYLTSSALTLLTFLIILKLKINSKKREKEKLELAMILIFIEILKHEYKNHEENSERKVHLRYGRFGTVDGL